MFKHQIYFLKVLLRLAEVGVAAPMPWGAHLCDIPLLRFYWSGDFSEWLVSEPRRIKYIRKVGFLFL